MAAQTQSGFDKRAAISKALQRRNVSPKQQLFKRPRILESTIRFILLFCGVISIFTTVGIVIVLGTEAALFFTPPAWLDTFKKVEVELGIEEDVIPVTAAGRPLEVGQVIRINNEQMLVEAVSEDGREITVERGYADTEIASHHLEAAVLRADEVTVKEFMTTTEWQPQLGNFGIWPLLNSTIIISTIAMLVSVPLGLAAAIYMSEYANSRVRSILKPILELLAGIPTVVYGYFALTFMTPLLRNIFGVDFVDIYNTTSAGIVVGVLIIPTIASISEDALRAVPDSLRQASYGMGATRLETIYKVIVPAAFSGIIAAFILGVSRAVGETMIVALAAGAGPNFTLNPFAGAETMTGHIVRISGGDISYNSIDYNSLFSIGLLLFIVTLTLNMISRAVTARFREVYE